MTATKAKSPAPEGLPLKETSAIVDQLRIALAETIVTQMKAQNFHWNVTGMSFGSLHELFEKIYKDHFKATDDLAERVRALGAPVDGRYVTFLDTSEIDESNTHCPPSRWWMRWPLISAGCRRHCESWPMSPTSTTTW